MEQAIINEHVIDDIDLSKFITEVQESDKNNKCGICFQFSFIDPC
jgi:hypothetical protein